MCEVGFSMTGCVWREGELVRGCYWICGFRGRERFQGRCDDFESPCRNEFQSILQLWRPRTD